MSSSGPKEQTTTTTNNTDARVYSDSRQFVDSRQDNRVYAPTTNTSINFNPTINFSINDPQAKRCGDFNNHVTPGLPGCQKPGSPANGGSSGNGTTCSGSALSNTSGSFAQMQQMIQQMLQGFMAQIQTIMGSNQAPMDPKGFLQGPSLLDGGPMFKDSMALTTLGNPPGMKV